jgi:DNA-binding PadR family transcriptional regulator
MVRHLADAARNASGWYTASIPNGGGSAGAMLAQGLIEFRVGEDGNQRSGYYLTAAGRTAAQDR